VTDTGHTVEETCAGALSSRACQDGVFKRLRFQTARGAGGIGLRGWPGRFGGWVALSGSYLVHAPCHKLAQAHNGLGVHHLRVVVVGRRGEQLRRVLDERLPNPFP